MTEHSGEPPVRASDGAEAGEASRVDTEPETSGRSAGLAANGGGAETSAAPDEELAASSATAAVADKSATKRFEGLHPLRGTLIALLGSVVPFLLMASDRHFGFSVAVGSVSCAIATGGFLDAIGAFDDRNVAATADLKKLGPRLIELIASGIVLVACLRLAVSGVLPRPIATAALLITASFLWMVVATFRAGQGVGFWLADETGKERGLLERHGFWLIAIATVLYLPLLGSFSLSDPWETHYGEVAREMMARDDWISLWWAQDGWFWSKPVFDFWMQALFFALLGVRFAPDQMLATAAEGRFPQPEWAARFPVFLLTLLGAYLLYKGVARGWGRRAGFIGALVLTTTPYWFLIAHQTMTDMPYVAPLSGGMGLLLLGFHSDPNAEVKNYELGIGRFRITLSAFHLVFGAIVLLVLPQILYLLSRNLTLQLNAVPHGFRPHPDEFFLGSGGGNCGLPGNEACRAMQPLNRQMQPALWGLIWTVLMGALLVFKRNERRVQRLCFIAGWALVAVSAMAKGAPGLVLPIFATLTYVGATRRWRDLERLELPAMVMLVTIVVLPWYVAMYMRHGQPFTDRLLFHDMYKRAFVHVHDTNVGDDVSFRYYVWQLGYGLFPWSGLAAGGLLWWMRRARPQADVRSDVSAFLSLWFVSGFAMFTISLTKFHHYVFPVVPPIAMFTGLLVDRMLGTFEPKERSTLLAYLGSTLAGAALFIYGCSRFFAGSISGALIDNHPRPAARGIASLCVLGGVSLLLWSARRFAPSDEPSKTEPTSEERFDDVMLAAIAIGSAVAVALTGRDLFTTMRGDIEGQSRLVHLFTYNYRRPWPESLNFDAILTAFTIAAALACLLLAIARIRTQATIVFGAVGILFCAWGVDVYHYKTAPHWGQRETILEYYRRRAGPQEPFVSYQMNWKGENFYTGNRTPAFVSSGQRFKDWIEEQKRLGVRVMYFTTEHGRASGLKSEIGPLKRFDVLTTPELNNKFMLARVEL